MCSTHIGVFAISKEIADAGKRVERRRQVHIARVFSSALHNTNQVSPELVSLVSDTQHIVNFKEMRFSKDREWE